MILYENEEGLVRLQEVIKMPKTFSGMKVTLRQLDMESNDYRPLLKEIKKSLPFNFVKCSSFQNWFK